MFYSTTDEKKKHAITFLSRNEKKTCIFSTQLPLYISVQMKHKAARLSPRLSINMEKNAPYC